MTQIPHESAKETHYDKGAEQYDTFNEENSKIINTTLETLLKKHGVKTVLDLTCGTGSQVFWLAKRGYEVIGSDFNQSMLKIAKDKAKSGNITLQFLEGDMRNVQVGQFDAVITIFNAVGHLTKTDFEKAMRNIHSNLNEGGFYIFDICNLSYLLKDNNITRLTIDWQKTVGDTRMRDIQYSTIDEEGILASHTIHYQWKGSEKQKTRTGSQTLQIYTAKQLKQMLEQNGFQILDQCALDGSEYLETESENIVMIAQKV
jgi:ubiquinone/menaquinone biosynthesis C-methylase UbiE